MQSRSEESNLKRRRFSVEQIEGFEPPSVRPVSQMLFL